MATAPDRLRPSPDFGTGLEEENDSIRGFVKVRTRGTYLIPPRSLRTLPTPDGGP